MVYTEIGTYLQQLMLLSEYLNICCLIFVSHRRSIPHIPGHSSHICRASCARSELPPSRWPHPSGTLRWKIPRGNSPANLNWKQSDSSVGAFHKDQDKWWSPLKHHFSRNGTQDKSKFIMFSLFPISQRNSFSTLNNLKFNIEITACGISRKGQPKSAIHCVTTDWQWPHEICISPINRITADNVIFNGYIAEITTSLMKRLMSNMTLILGKACAVGRPHQIK